MSGWYLIPRDEVVAVFRAVLAGDVVTRPEWWTPTMHVMLGGTSAKARDGQIVIDGRTHGVSDAEALAALGTATSLAVWEE